MNLEDFICCAYNVFSWSYIIPEIAGKQTKHRFYGARSRVSVAHNKLLNQIGNIVHDRM